MHRFRPGFFRFTLHFAIYFSVIFGGLFIPARGWTFPIQMGLSPDNSRDLLVSALQSAQSDITINIYEFNQLPLANVVADLIRARKNVQILIEGEPVGKMSEEGRKVLALLQKTMRDVRNPKNRLFLMRKSDDGEPRRFNFDHAKYVVIDSSRVLISSENFSKTGHPQSGVRGNRGWEILLDRPAIARSLIEIFQADTGTDYADVIELTRSSIINNTVDHPRADRATSPSVALQDGSLSTPIARGEASQATLATSPRSLEPLLAFIRSARNHLDIEEMSLPLNWRNPEVTLNPLVNGMIDAARTYHAQIRILLNDESVFGGQPLPFFMTPVELEEQRENKGNALTVEYLQTLARREHLPIEARIINYRNIGITYLHNKGMIADGQRVWVGSVNGTRNSVMNNREVGVSVDSPDAAQYFGRAFELDWSESSDSSRSLNDPVI